MKATNGVVTAARPVLRAAEGPWLTGSAMKRPRASRAISSCQCGVGRRVVDHDARQALERGQEPSQLLGAVADGDHHGDVVRPVNAGRPGSGQEDARGHQPAGQHLVGPPVPDRRPRRSTAVRARPEERDGTAAGDFRP